MSTKKVGKKTTTASRKRPRRLTETATIKQQKYVIQNSNGDFIAHTSYGIDYSSTSADIFDSESDALKYLNDYEFDDEQGIFIVPISISHDAKKVSMKELRAVKVFNELYNILRDSDMILTSKEEAELRSFCDNVIERLT